jgi:hypothetical protein
MNKILISILSIIVTLLGHAQNNNLSLTKDYIGNNTGFAKIHLPVFEENKGQVTGEDADKVRFIFKDEKVTIFLLENGIAYQFSKKHYPNGFNNSHSSPEGIQIEEKLDQEIKTETYRMDVILKGANQNPIITTEGKSKDYIQYYNHDALNVYSYNKIIYHDVYPNIDWVVYTNDHTIKYDFIVHPGGDPSLIKMQTEWVEEISKNNDGSLSLRNRMGSITEQNPFSFQGEEIINTQFLVDDQIVSFGFEDFDPSQILIVDPSLQWETYYGGSGSDFSLSSVTDASGNVYLSGQTESINNIASGGYQNSFSGYVHDAFLVKFNSNGVRQWATYYGGNNQSDGNSCAIDDLGNVYLCGSTSATSNIAYLGHQNTYNGTGGDAFLVKFNSNGIRQWGTYFGDIGIDEGASCVTDPFGNVYLSGWTQSTANIAMGGHQNTFGGGQFDAFLAKFNDTGVLQWSTYYGGSESERGISCASDNSGNIFLSGNTASYTGISSNGFQNIYAGSVDAFLSKFDTNGSLVWSTYFGGTGSESGEKCVVNSSGDVYLAGNTASTSYTPFDGHQTIYGGNGDAFLAKFDNAGSFQWATYYGGSEWDRGYACAVDDFGFVYLGGVTESPNNISHLGHQNIHGGIQDAFLVQFNSSGVRQWATYYGGSGYDYGQSCSTDSFGNVYLSGYTDTLLNMSVGGHQDVYGGGWRDGFLVKFESDICIPSYNDDFINTCSNYTWIDGNTYTTSTNTPTYTYIGGSANGCDSIVTLNLTINNLVTGTDIQICL